MMWWGGMEGWGWGMAIAHSVLWWVILGVGIVLLVRLLRREPQGGAPPTETALDVLKKRYARGEIGQEEFEQKRRDLEA
jgi:putative membrane protein